MNEMTGQFEETKDPLKIDPLGMAIIVFLLGILVVQTIGKILRFLNHKSILRLNMFVRDAHSSSEHHDWSVPRSKSTARPCTRLQV